MKEIKIHHKYPCYGFTPCGKVYSFKRHQWLSTKITQNGYVQATLRAYNKTIYVHRMVADLFCTGKGAQVNHIDGNKQNNHFSNLEWCTAKENRQHAFTTGLQKMPTGDACWNTKVPTKLHDEMRRLRATGLTHRAIGKLLGCSRSRVGQILDEGGRNSLKCNDQSKRT